MLTMKAKYGLKAMLRLAREHGRGPVLIADLATTEGIPRKFLELILLELKQHGMLQSKKGKGGGYLLARRPGDITVGMILRVLDGPLAPVPCVSHTGYRPCDECREPAICSIRLLMREVHDATTHILDATNLEQMAERSDAELRGRGTALRYHI
jgi:Rrf2 family protein